ncbi:hypothetical protein R1sor_023359 [Riccia sorocarpa]|uniref:Uncharacterized protein n=1 Tax=Riccia sorocarpa TaxID=122646 RepID=A0ABD3GME3_9MARC
MSSAPPPPAFVALARQPTLKQLARQRSAVVMPPPPPPERATTSRPTTSIRKPTVTKLLNVSMTVGIAREDVPAETFDRLSAYLEQNAKIGIMAFERRDAHLLLHIQGMYWNSMNPMELMLAYARERQIHAGYNLKPPPFKDNDNGEYDVPDPDAETRPDLGTDQTADPIPTEVPVINLTNAQQIDDADNVQYHDNEEGHRDEIQPNTEKPTEQALAAFIDLTGINHIYDMEENRPPSAEDVTAPALNLTDAGMKEKHHENTEATECVPKLFHSDGGAIDNEHDRGLGRTGEQQTTTETNAEKQATNVPSEPLPLTTDMEGIDINDLDTVDLQTMVPPDMDSQLLTNDFLQMGYSVRRPRTDHIPDVEPKMRIRRILEVKRKHDQQTSKAPDFSSQVLPTLRELPQ